MSQSRPQALGERIRSDLEGRIVSGEWPPGHRVPSEQALTAEYGCARMTVNKVLSGMAGAGLIVRRRRAGSFVAAPQGERAVMQIQDLATEAAARGLSYRYDMLSRGIETLDAAGAAALGLGAGARVLRLHGLHRMNGLPVAYEDRSISLEAVPAAQDATFEDAPPGTWLLRNVPWSEAEHVISARNADARLAGLLELEAGAACLVLERRTWHQGMAVTVVSMTYPANRHRFVGRFSPTTGG